MPVDEPNEPSRGALPGPAQPLANTVALDGIVAPGFRPGQGASNPDWNSGENNLAMYRDPAEVSWERIQAMNAETQTPEASADNGSAQVQQPQVPKRGRGRPKKSVQDNSPRTGRSVDVPVSDLSRDRDADQTQLQEDGESRAHKGREVARKPGDLMDAAVDSKEWGAAQRNQALLGFNAFERFIQEAPLKDAFILFNDLSTRLMTAANHIENRRLQEKKAENSCAFCDHEFTYRGSDQPKARRAFDLPNGIMQVVIACGKTKCIDAFEDYVNDMATRSRATLKE